MDLLASLHRRLAALPTTANPATGEGNPAQSSHLARRSQCHKHDTAMHARLLALVATVHGLRAPTQTIKRTAPLKALKLHGSQGSRSPLVNWYLEELNVQYEMAPPKPSDHPFGQIPYLTDGDVGVFESGAILLYIACLLYTSPSPRDKRQSRMPSSA